MFEGFIFVWYLKTTAVVAVDLTVMKRKEENTYVCMIVYQYVNHWSIALCQDSTCPVLPTSTVPSCRSFNNGNLHLPLHI